MGKRAKPDAVAFVPVPTTGGEHGHCRDQSWPTVLQLTFIPYITHQGGWRALIEGVRVAAAFRSGGVGKQMLSWAIERARDRNCHMVQLTSDKTRADAIRFYEQLGFVASHEGMKLHLERRGAG